ncbi:MAG: hypothetical protein EOP53_28100, partial [Sphingobacteriales bacterium]
MVNKLKGNTYPTNYLRSVLDDKYSLIGSYQNKAELWDNRNMQPVYNLSDRLKTNVGIYLSPSNRIYATSDRENKLQVWDTPTGQLLNEIACGIEKGGSGVIVPLWAQDREPAKPATINAGFTAKHAFERGIFSPDETLIVTASPHEGGASVWDLQQKKLKISFDIGAPGIYEMAFSPSGKQIAAAGRSGAAVIVNLQNSQLISLKGHTSNVNSILFNKAGTKILTASADSTIVIWDALTGQRIKSIKASNTVYSACFSADEKKILVIGGGIFIGYDAASFQQLFEIKTKAAKITLMKNPSLVLLWGEYSEKPPLIFNITTFKTVQEFPADMR